MKFLKCISLFLSLVAAFSGCGPNDSAGLVAFEVTTNILATITRADGSSIPDVTAAIEQQFGFRAQTMNFVVPELTVHMASPASEVDPKNFASQTIVTDWATVTQQVINDAEALPFTLHVDGMSPGDCGSHSSSDCPVLRLADNYGDYFAAQAQKGLGENFMLRVIGIDSSGNTKVQAFSPSKVTYVCVIDHTRMSGDGRATFNEIYASAIQCSGQVEFHIN